MISPVLTPPGDPDFLHVLNRRFEDLSTLIEALQAKSAAAAATPDTAAATPRAQQQSAVESLISTSSGTRKQRLVYVPEQLNGGSVWWETDTQLLYIVHVTNEAHSWKYLAGRMSGLLSAKPTGLTTGDAGVLYYATDFARTFEWSGSAWANAKGETPQDVIVFAAASPGTGWSLCDGSTATYSTATGSTTSKSKPNLVGSYPKGASSYSSSVVAATNPTLSGSTADESSHTHGSGSLATGGPSGTTTFGGGAFSAPNQVHTHAISGSTDAGSAHHHGVGTLAASGGEPQHLNIPVWVRL